MITKIKVNEFNSLKNVEIDFSKITVFSGVNEEGIEDVFKLFDYLHYLFKFGLLESSRFNNYNKKSIRVNIFSEDFEYEIYVRGRHKEHGYKSQDIEFECLKSKNGENVFTFESDKKAPEKQKSCFLDMKQECEKKRYIQNLSKEGIKRYIPNLSEEGIIGYLDENEKVLSFYKSILNLGKFSGFNIPLVLQDLLNYVDGECQNKEIYENLIKDLRRFYPNISKLEIAWDIFMENELKIDGVSLDNISSGMLNILNLCLLKYEKEKRTYVLVNPENNLHPKLQVELAKLLVEIDANFIISSNSPYFIQGLRVAIEDSGRDDSEICFYNVKNNIVENVTNDLNKIFTHLSEPLQNIVWS